MEIEPLVATIATTARILECSDQTVRELIGRGELESFLDGRIRKVMMLSIKGYVARKLAAVQRLNNFGLEPGSAKDYSRTFV